jgi:hypothetical protein
VTIPNLVDPEDPPDFTDSCWPVDVSCVSDWDDTVVVPADPDADPPVVQHTEPKYTDRQKAYAVALAGQTMRMLTAYRVGGCPITVRPCRRNCTWPTWQVYPVLGYSGSTPWVPVNLGGQWINIGCGHNGGCGCSATYEVALHGPASAVTQVKVDGVVLDPTAYRLDRGGRLVRVDGDGWPLCQNLDAPDTEDGTWSVTYRQGVAVDGQGALAAGALAGQYVRACSGTDCDLPKTVTQVVRNGVTVTLAPGAFPNGKTGVTMVDTYLERWNPTGRRSAPMMVWSPDVRRPR